MKKVFHPYTIICWILSAVLIFSIPSCKKDANAGPQISRVRTMYKSVTDTTTSYTITYNNVGGTVVVDSVLNTVISTNLVNFDSTTTTGLLQNMYAILGSNFATTTQVLFNGYSVYFNPALLSNNSIIVTIPKNTPDGPNQTNTLTVITLHGRATFNFSIPFPAPTIVSLSNYDFYAGSSITLKGVGFSSVSHVALTGVNDTATIISKSDSVLTLKMPATTANRANLVFTYGSGTVTSTQEFVDIDNAYQIFALNNFQNGWGDASWSGPSGVSTAAYKTSTSSYIVTFPAGGWKIEGAANWYPGITYDPTYKYLCFWIKGGTVAHNLVLVGDQMAGGYSQNTSPLAAQNINVPPAVWTYFKIPLGAPGSTNPKLLNYWANGTTAKQLGFFLQGQTGDVDETFYLDDLMFVK
jgi:hypothetical protein